MDSFLPSQINISIDTLLGITGTLAVILLVFLVLLFRTTRKISALQSLFADLTRTLQHSTSKLDAISHQHGAIVDNIKSVELVVSKDVDALRHELIRQVEKIFDLSDEEFSRATEILIPRLEAYKQLWEITETISSTGSSIEQSTKENLIADLNAWYFENGNGIFLSNEASELLTTAMKSLKSTPVADAKARFSELRIQLKNDIALYDEIETEKVLDNLTA